MHDLAKTMGSFFKRIGEARTIQKGDVKCEAKR